ncbi:hypothetical protein R5R35_010883 [Gryllus longicercus]|uniref:C2H2-type domain-containing protein n=1 Tax=Gryllus longicercus TaxID=2509291 RepID=A0AAN9Z089_9ORTH
MINKEPPLTTQPQNVWNDAMLPPLRPFTPPLSAPVSSGNMHMCGCGKMYLRCGSLQRHQKLECGKMPQMCCPYCEYRAKRVDSLRSR